MLSLRRIVARLLMPLLGLNLAGLGAAALWLVSEGQMQVIWLGFTMLFLSPLIIPILLIPAGVFSHYMAHYGAAGRTDREKLMFFLSLAYIIMFLTFWCIGIFEYVTQNVGSRAHEPGVLWASTTALAPLLWWCSRDPNNFFIMLLVEAAQGAVLILAAVLLLKGENSFWLFFSAFGGFLALVATLRSVYEKKYINQVEKRPIN